MPTDFPRPPLVLVAEDEPEASKLIAMILRRAGCEVLLASDGATALEMARELPRPDLVLLDLELPVMDGLQRVLARLRGAMPPEREPDSIVLA